MAKKTAKTTTVAVPTWLTNAMQGICYWVGHRRAYYRHHSLFEGAITGELANLINSQIGTNDRLHCEVQYADLIEDRVPGVDRKIRMDLVVRTLPVEGKHDSENITVIEVKRGSASKQDVIHDITRLAALKEVMPEISAYVLIVSENKLPTQQPWIKKDEDGTTKITANTEIMSLHTPNGGIAAKFKVRRVCKALASTQPKSGHTAILIEVLAA